jgi:hypothetical protein
LYVPIYNSSSWTQTVLGFRPEDEPGGLAENPDGTSAALGICVRVFRHEWEGLPYTDHYGLPVAI